MLKSAIAHVLNIQHTMRAYNHNVHHIVPSQCTTCKRAGIYEMDTVVNGHLRYLLMRVGGGAEMANLISES